jgi:hypothetical protein
MHINDRNSPLDLDSLTFKHVDQVLQCARPTEDLSCRVSIQLLNEWPRSSHLAVPSVASSIDQSVQEAPVTPIPIYFGLTSM